jgi:hypothetical protein
MISPIPHKNNMVHNIFSILSINKFFITYPSYLKQSLINIMSDDKNNPITHPDKNPITGPKSNMIITNNDIKPMAPGIHNSLNVDLSNKSLSNFFILSLHFLI